MASEQKDKTLHELSTRIGAIRRLPHSQSLFDVGDGAVRIYFRYSRVHDGVRAFFGMRDIDLNQLDGHNSFVCLLTDSAEPALFLPYQDFEQVIRQSTLAADGQFKAQLVAGSGTREIYLPKVGRFNVDGYGGVEAILERMGPHLAGPINNLTHAQVQTLLVSIGRLKGFGAYVPANNAATLDWSLASECHLVSRLPADLEARAPFASEIDVVWLEPSRNAVTAVFEVEHSTPIYSGLLRFNDMLLTCTGAPRFFIVSNEGRRDLFSRQLQRPTFQRSGLSEITSFLEYSNVSGWHRRLNEPQLRPVA